MQNPDPTDAAIEARGVQTVLDALSREVDAARTLVDIAPAVDWSTRRDVAEALTLIRALLTDALDAVVSAQVAVEVARVAAL